MLYFTVLVLAIIVLFWLIGYVYANDFSVPTVTNLSKFKKILVVFPHADDEALTCGGLMTVLSQQEAEVIWVVLTKGERGVEGAEFHEELKPIRVQEAQKAAKQYGVRKVIQGEITDNAVSDHVSELEETMAKVLDEFQPDLVITYDQTGLYGHPDHIVVSEVITQLVADRPTTNLWYTSIPERRQNAINLPEHMAKDSDFKTKRVYPTHKVWIGLPNMYKKISALYAYRSQLFGFKKSMPVSQLPLWFYVSMMPYEYFYEVE